jgi:ArsR family transcriptional regulator, arsenate/arsenite/antimonite-responsive transcriptional repressor
MSLAAHLRVLADPTRLKILEFLRDPILTCCSRAEGICACDLETFLDLAQPTVSHHLKQLLLAGFVRAERRGRWTYYDLVPERFHEVAAALTAFADAAPVADGVETP